MLVAMWWCWFFWHAVGGVVVGDIVVGVIDGIGGGDIVVVDHFG